jgi:hypothetical protein
MARNGLPAACPLSSFFYEKKLKKLLDFWPVLWYIITMKARKNKDGFMGSASREHRVKKGKGSFRRQKKHKKNLR